MLKSNLEAAISSYTRNFLEAIDCVVDDFSVCGWEVKSLTADFRKTDITFAVDFYFEDCNGEDCEESLILRVVDKENKNLLEVHWTDESGQSLKTVVRK